MGFNLDRGMSADQCVKIQIVAGGEGFNAVFEEIVEMIAAIEAQEGQKVWAKLRGQPTKPLGLPERSVHRASDSKAKTYNHGRLYSVQVGMNSTWDAM